jgi:hypothetical protein
MKVSNWNPEQYNGMFINASMDRVRKAAHVVRNKARLLVPQGTISRPAYKSGKYAGKIWTRRHALALMRSIRVVEKNEDGGLMYQHRNVRVYAGNYIVFYAKIVEFMLGVKSRYPGKPFLRPALNSAKGEIQNILENG